MGTVQSVFKSQGLNRTNILGTEKESANHIYDAFWPIITAIISFVPRFLHRFGSVLTSGWFGLVGHKQEKAAHPILGM